MHFYKHHIGDYASATTHLSWDEDMVYTRLLRVYYRDEKPLPRELEKIKRLIDCSTTRRIAALRCVLREFFVYQKDGYHNKRADEEIEATGSQKQANRKIALAREAAKREARFVHDPTTIRSPSETQDPRPEIRDPLPKTQDPEGSNGSDIDLSQSGEISLERRTVRAVTAVFDHWRKVWKHPKAVLDPKRKKAIAAQLRRYSADDLCKAISGYLKSEHHTGKNDRNTVYDDIGLLLRDAAHIDAGIQLADAPPPCRRHTSAELEVRERIRQTLQARSNNISDPELAEESRASIEEVRYWRPQLSATETEQRH